MSDEDRAGDVDLAAVGRDLTSCERSHSALVAHLRSLGHVDPGAPTLLPDWTVGHVLTHVARNGDSHLDMLAGRPQYPSVESRNAGIEAGSTRSWAELVDDVERAGRAVDEAYAHRSDWTGTATTMGGDRPLVMLPLMRQREVEVHRADLGLGYGFEDMPGDYVRRDLRLMVMLWRARKPMGLTPLPETALALAPAIRLAWMMGRVEIDGLAPAGLF